jgi:hypothetical protein
MKSTSHEHLRLLRSLIAPIGGLVYDCHWLLQRLTRRALLTSDHPVSLHVDSDFPSFLGVGIANAHTFLIPLSRRLALTAQRRERLPPEMQDAADFSAAGTTRAAKSINQATAANARRYIYHHPNESPLEGLSLPQPNRQRFTMNGGGSFISEAGMFPDADSDTPRRFPRSSYPTDTGESFSIDNLPWPIPGRSCRRSISGRSISHGGGKPARPLLRWPSQHRMLTSATVTAYSHRYSQACRRAPGEGGVGRLTMQVSGGNRRLPTVLSIFARQGLGVRVPSLPQFMASDQPFRTVILPTSGVLRGAGRRLPTTPRRSRSGHLFRACRPQGPGSNWW